MREYELTIDDALNNGLSPKAAIPSNSPLLYTCLGFRCGQIGLEPYVEGENPLPNTIDMYYDWPFPQFFRGERYNLLVVRDTVNHEDVVYSVSDDYNFFSLVTALDEITYGQGTLMEVADFGEYAIMVNGVSITYWDTVASAWHTVVNDPNIPLMRTICNFKGQAVGGNIPGVWHDCDETYYIWSKIGNLDFTPGNDNEAGYRRCPFGGEVHHVRRLGDAVIGYSSKGITLLFPVSDPVPSFGFKELNDVGIVNQGAMNGNQFRQLYVGTDYRLRSVTNEGVKDLGYEHLISQLAGEDIIVSFDKDRNDFYIGNSTRTFLLSPKGMTEIPQHPSTVWRVESDVPYMLPDTVDDFYPTIVVEAIDFGHRGIKSLAVVETDAHMVYDAQVGTDYAFNLNDWRSMDYKPINGQGVGTLNMSGIMFRPKVRFSSLGSPFRIGYIKLRYKMEDLRSLRGVYAPPTSLRGQQ